MYLVGGLGVVEERVWCVGIDVVVEGLVGCCYCFGEGGYGICDFVVLVVVHVEYGGGDFVGVFGWGWGVVEDYGCLYVVVVVGEQVV